jgi:hypothetical protein
VQDVSPLVLEPLLRDHAVNVLEVAFFFRRLLDDDYPKEDRKWWIKRRWHSVKSASRQASHNIQVGWQWAMKKKENRKKIPEPKPVDIKVEAREEIKK